MFRNGYKNYFGRNSREIELIANVFQWFFATILFSIMVLRMVYSTKLALYFFTLLFVFYIKDILYKYILKHFFNIVFERSFFQSINRISLLMVIADVFFKPILLFLPFSTIILWQNPFRINGWGYSDREKFNISFLNTFIHLLLLALTFILALLATSYGWADFSQVYAERGLSFFNVDSMIGQALFYAFCMNVVGVVINLLPFAPFDMGCFLESEASDSSPIVAMGKVGSFLAFFIYYMGYDFPIYYLLAYLSKIFVRLVIR